MAVLSYGEHTVFVDNSIVVSEVALEMVLKNFPFIMIARKHANYEIEDSDERPTVAIQSPLLPARCSLKSFGIRASEESLSRGISEHSEPTGQASLYSHGILVGWE